MVVGMGFSAYMDTCSLCNTGIDNRLHNCHSRGLKVRKMSDKLAKALVMSLERDGVKIEGSIIVVAKAFKRLKYGE